LGWDKKRASNIEDDNYADKLAVVLQKWLFFGLITEFFGTANVRIKPATSLTGRGVITPLSQQLFSISCYRSGRETSGIPDPATGAENCSRFDNSRVS
jgi:hypothetical protein